MALLINIANPTTGYQYLNIINPSTEPATPAISTNLNGVIQSYLLSIILLEANSFLVEMLQRIKGIPRNMQ